MSVRWLGSISLIIMMLGAAKAGEPSDSYRLAGPASVDRSVDPGVDFTAFASGRWIEAQTLTQEKPFASAMLEASTVTRSKLEDAILSSGLKTSEDAEQISSFYEAFLDTDQIDKLGIRPALPWLNEILLADKEKLAEIFGRMGAFAPVLGPSFGPDPNAPNTWTAFLWLDGLSMTADRYSGDADEPVRVGLQSYMKGLLLAADWPIDAGMPAALLAFETKLAQLQWPDQDRRDRLKTNNPKSISELASFAPGFDWHRFSIGAGTHFHGRFMASEADAMPRFAALVQQTDINVLRAWTAYRFLDATAAVLPAEFRMLRYRFRGEMLNRQPMQSSRLRLALNATQTSLSYQVGQEYAATISSAEDVQKVFAMAEVLRSAMHERIRSASWLDEQTRSAALIKLTKMEFRIGPPPPEEAWVGIKLDKASAFENQMKVNRANWHGLLARLDEGGATRAWLQRPQIMSGLAVLEQNVVYIPPALFQPPYYHRGGDAAANYGALGAVIGHEILHHFDDQGRKFDGSGRLNNWWTPQSEAQFELRSKQLQSYLSTLSFYDVKLDGALITTETIADIGGVGLAFEAFQMQKGRPASTVDEAQESQQFFVSWAQLHQSAALPDIHKGAVLVTPFLPGTLRGVEPLRHLEGWYRAFNLDADDPLYLPSAQRLDVWRSE